MRGMINLLGPLYVRVFRRGASEVKSKYQATATDSSARVTVITPTSGKKVRVISVNFLSTSSTATDLSAYFGTEVSISIDATKAIIQLWVDVDTGANGFNSIWPDGGGPVGAVDEVVSMRTGADVSNGVTIVVHYREE